MIMKTVHVLNVNIVNVLSTMLVTFYIWKQGIIRNKIKDREEYRRNKFESDYFTFRWTVEDGVKKFQGKHLI